MAAAPAPPGGLRGTRLGSGYKLEALRARGETGVRRQERQELAAAQCLNSFT